MKSDQSVLGLLDIKSKWLSSLERLKRHLTEIYKVLRKGEVLKKILQY